jgi:hypothetical protein
MRRMLSTFVLSCLAPLTASAACYTYYCQGQVHSMSIAQDGVYIRLAGDVAGLSTCTPYENVYFTLPRTHPNYSAIYAALLAAYHTKDSILLRPVDGSAGCSISYVAVP